MSITQDVAPSTSLREHWRLAPTQLKISVVLAVLSFVPVFVGVSDEHYVNGVLENCQATNFYPPAMAFLIVATLVASLRQINDRTDRRTVPTVVIVPLGIVLVAIAGYQVYSGLWNGAASYCS